MKLDQSDVVRHPLVSKIMIVMKELSKCLQLTLVTIPI